MKKFLSIILTVAMMLTMVTGTNVFAGDLTVDNAFLTVDGVQTTQLTPDDSGNIKYNLVATGKMDGYAVVTYYTSYNIDANGTVTPGGELTHQFSAQSGGSKQEWSVTATVSLNENFTADAEVYRNLPLVKSIANEKTTGGKLQYPEGTSAPTLAVTLVPDSDNVPPVITLNGNASVYAEAGMPYVDAGATAYDTFDGNLTPVATSTVDTSKIGSYKVEYNVSDSSGNKATTVTRTVIVKDTIAPEIKLNGALTVTAEAGMPYVDAGATAYDTFDGTLIPVATSTVDTSKLGNYKVEYNVSDAAGNQAVTVARTVIVKDTIAPEITAPLDKLNVEATGILTPVEIGLASAKDLFLKEVTNDAPKDGFNLGTTTVTWMATDTSANYSTATQIIQIVDTTKPELSAPADIVVTLTGALTQVNIGSAIASDLFLKEVTNDAPKDGFKLGTTTVTWKATDTSGNYRTATQKITVKYAFSGILQPINSDGTSVFKKGSTVPVKFQLRDANETIITDAKGIISYVKVFDIPTGGINEASFTDAISTGNVFRYDASSQQYIFNMNTKSMDTGEYMIKIDLGDNSPQYVKIGLR